MIGSRREQCAVPNVTYWLFEDCADVCQEGLGQPTGVGRF